jgi:hypothetical protein
MSRRWTVAVLLAGLTLLLPSTSAGQVYFGAAFGGGGANVPFGSDVGGIRGTLRLFGGYEFNRFLAAEAMTLDLGTPGSRPQDTSTIGAFGVAAVGTLPLQRWRFSGRVGVMSVDGRTSETSVKRSGQTMTAVAISFNVVRGLTLGLETAASRVEFPPPAITSARVKWTAAAAAYRF